jgi:uncharacterized protein with PIN domain
MPQQAPLPSSPAPPLACDAMLGGLARWLRAAGYDASWHPVFPDAAWPAASWPS